MDKKQNSIQLLTGLLLVLASLVLLAGCKPEILPGGENSSLYNQSLNDKIENLTNTNTTALPEFKEFMFNYTPTNRSKYELAADDAFMLSKGNLSSLQISVFGVMLGDSYEAVVERLGIPDLSFTPADNSYTNIDYRAKLGIGGTDPGLTIHVENNTVTQMIIKSPMNKYLRGNTTLGQDKELIYYLFDPPDYNSFLSSFKVFHYVEKGMDFYLKADNVDRIAFYYPREFKGVEYRTVQREVGPGIFNNITEPFEIV